MKCILHIGTEKTGTTSFQTHMASHRRQLAALGVLYPKSLGSVNHRTITVAAAEPGKANAIFDGIGLETVESHAEFIARLDERFRAELAAHSGLSLCLISSEHLHSRLKTLDDLSRLRAFLNAHFPEIIVYLHLRPQVDMMVSLASTRSRRGRFLSEEFFSHPTEPESYFDYLDLVTKWQTVFGAAALRIIPFRREPDIGRRIFADLNLDLTGLSPIVRSNEAIDIKMICMINAIAVSGRKVRLPLRFIDQFDLTEPLSLSRARARDFQNRHLATNARLLVRVPNLLPEDLEPDWNRYPEQGNEHMLSRPCDFGIAVSDLASAYVAALAKSKPKPPPRKRRFRWLRSILG